MFSGIIEQKAKILSIENGTITVENTFSEPLEIGQSIAHDGACMTVTEFDSQKYSFFAMEESFVRTSFGKKQVGDNFNVERSLKFGGKVDGHFVTGHIDTLGKVKNLEKKSDGSLVITVNCNAKYKNNIIEKGSVCVNGVSLTVVENGDDWFSVSLIWLTQDMTNLGQLQVGDSVNLEFDMMGKYIVAYMDNLETEGK